MGHIGNILENIDDLSELKVKDIILFAQGLKKIKSSNDHRYLKALRNRCLGKTLLTYFKEPSTRTLLSFQLAAKLIGMDILNFSEQTSSLKKGECLEETFATLKALGIDICAFRTNESHETRKYSHLIPIINCGDGGNEHPTQALIDLMTLLETSINLKNKNILIVGDSLHSRVYHSLSPLLKLFGMNAKLCGPKKFLDIGDGHIESLKEGIKWSDYVYVLRPQFERHKETKGTDFIENYKRKYLVDNCYFTNKEIPYVLHPGPANLGVEISTSIMHSSHFLGYKQVQNGLYLRAAVITLMLFNKEELSYFGLGPFNNSF